jgi:hypothetical protein
MSAFGSKADIDQPRLPISIYEYTADRDRTPAAALLGVVAADLAKLTDRLAPPADDGVI